MTMLHFFLYIEIKYVLVKHVCFLPVLCLLTRVLLIATLEVNEKPKTFLHDTFFSISGFLISPSQDCILLFSPDKLKSSTATKIDTQSLCALRGRSAQI